jgi:protein SCO1/2
VHSSSRRLQHAGVFFALVIGAGLLAASLARHRAVPARTPPLPAATTLASGSQSLPAFGFVDQHGQRVSRDDLAAHVWIFDFVYTTCTSLCPTLTAKLAALQRKLPSPELRFVSFSVDPSHDTPEALARYAASYRPGETRWLLLSTEPVGLTALANGLGLAVEPTGDRRDPILHPSAFFLVDRGNRSHGRYDSTDPSALARLAADALRLAGGGIRAAERDGAELVEALGCRGCHDDARLAPRLGAAWGQQRELDGAPTVTVDERYIRESILDPASKVVRGYPNLMPAYGSELSATALDALVAHLRDLAQDGGTQGAEEARARESVAVDPVCGMKVRVTDQTPHADHASHRYYFCSPVCAEGFEKDPERFAARP